MPRRPLQLLWLLLALLLAGQSLLPVTALAQVSVRCVGAPASAAPCAQGTFAVADAATIRRHFAGLACCRRMTARSTGACPMMGGTRASGMVMGRASASAPHCRVTVSLLNVKPAALGQSTHRWLFLSCPALAPPVSAGTRIPVRLSPTPFTLLPAATAHANVLRGPPCV